MKTDEKQLWNVIVDSYGSTPRDVSTTPTNREPKWFYVSSDGRDIFISSGKAHGNKATISACRTLDKNNLSKIYELYCLRKRGLLRRSDATAVTQNSSYWFGIFEDLHL